MLFEVHVNCWQSPDDGQMDEQQTDILLVNFDLRRIKDQMIRIYSMWKGKQVETVIKRYHTRYILHYHDYIGNFQHFTQLSL